jgi:hypothetical protein
MDVYIAAVSQNNEAASTMAGAYSDNWPYEWREQMKDLHAACEKALQDLDRHRSEHER